jgi:hypothetical protein
MTAPTSSQIKPGILKALRKATDIAIKFNPRTIVLIPQKKIKGNGGQIIWQPQTPRAAQVFTIEPVGSTLAGITGTAGGLAQSTSGGTGHEWYYNLTGAWDSEMDINDQWTDGDMTYRITAIQPFNGYEKVAVVVSFGSDPNYGS